MVAKKKPVEILVARWRGDLGKLVDVFGSGVMEEVFYDRDDNLFVSTFEGDHRVNIGDVIAQGVEGEYYPIKWSIFVKTYEVRCDDEIGHEYGFYPPDAVNW